MKSPRFRWLVGAMSALLVVVASGCSGSSSDNGGPSARASGTSVAQLCGALTDFQADLASADTTNVMTYVAQLKAAATRLQAVGLPDEMPDDARASFEKQVDIIAALSDSATSADLTAVSRAAEDPALGDYLEACATTPG